MPSSPSFDLAGIRAGFIACLPVAVGVITYGLVYGVLAGQAGMSAAEVVGLSCLVYAGSSQFVVLDMWSAPLPVAAMIITTFAVNLRHVLMGASLPPWFHELSWGRKALSAHFMVDEGWAMTMAAYAKGNTQASYLLGTGLCLFWAWVGSAWAGLLAGSLLPDPASLGLDFAFTAVFLSLLAALWRGRADLPPWVVATVVAVECHHFLPGKWYIILGGLAGGLVGAFTDPRIRCGRGGDGGDGLGAVGDDSQEAGGDDSLGAGGDGHA